MPAIVDALIVAAALYAVAVLALVVAGRRGDAADCVILVRRLLVAQRPGGWRTT